MSRSKTSAIYLKFVYKRNARYSDMLIGYLDSDWVEVSLIRIVHPDTCLNCFKHV